MVDAIKTADSRVTYVGRAVLADGTLDDADHFKLTLSSRKYKIGDTVQATEKGLTQFRPAPERTFFGLHRGSK